MSTSLATTIRLRAIQNKTRQLFENMSDMDYRLQFHPELSPAGWYLGHGLFMENYWLHEIITGNNEYTADHSLYWPENCPRAQRGPRLPPLKQLLEDLRHQQDRNDLLLLEMMAPEDQHPLFRDEYIENHIIQHYACHYEDIQMVLNQIALKRQQRLRNTSDFRPQHDLRSISMEKNLTAVEPGDYPVGGKPPVCQDNELPAHRVQLGGFYIADRPVSNGEFLSFIEDDGYSTHELWCDEGWQWRCQHNIQQPEYWLQNNSRQWYGINQQGPFELLPDDAVYGLSHYEARAFAHWAGARLPHEHEWETASRLSRLKNTAQVWEWCANPFYTYEGFRPMPAEHPSTDEALACSPAEHPYVLKGGSPFTRPEIKRACFRNFYPPHFRHIFAGLRLVYT